MFGKGLSSNDIQALTQFNNQIKNGISYSQAYKNSLSNCSVAGKQMAVQIAKGKVSVDSLTNASKASAIGMGLLNAAMNFGIMMAVTGLIELGKYLWKLVPTTEHLKKSLEETAQALSDIRSERESINDELKTTEERIAELESKGTLSFTDAAELNRLNKENAALKTKIELLDIEAKKTREKNQNNFNKLIDKEETNTSNKSWTSVDYNGNSEQYRNITDKEKLLELAEIYDEVAESKKDYLDVRGFSHSIEDVEKEITDFSSVVQEYQGYLDDLYQDGFDYNSADEETKQNIDYANEIIDRYMVLVGKTDTLWERVYNSDRFSEARTEIEKLAEAGNLSAESLQNLYNQKDNVKEFYNYISKIFGYDTSNIDNQTDAIKKQADAYNALVNGNVDYNKRPLISPEKMKVVYPEFDGEIATTYDMDFGLSSNITGEIIYTVKATPILEDGTILDQDSLDKYIYEELQPIVDNGGSTEDLLAYDKTHKNILINVDVGETERNSEGLTELDIQLGEIKNSHWELTKQLNDSSGFENFANELNKVEDAADEAESSFKSIAKTLSDGLDKLSDKKDILSKVKEELDSFGAISADNISKILDEFSDNDDVQKAVSYYLSGLGTAQQVYDAMAKGYKDSLKLQAENLATQMQNDENYYKSLAKLHGDFLNFKVGNYTIDISNEKNLATAKLKIENNLIKTLKTNWSSLYQIQGKNLAQLEKYAREQVAKAPGSIERRLAQDFLSDVLSQKRIYDNAVNEFNNLALKGFNSAGFNASLSTKFDTNSGKTAAEKYFEEQKYLLETNKITQEEYLKRIDQKYKEFYNKTADYLEDYAKYSQEVYDGFKDMYKDDLNAQKDAWEEKKKAVSEYYDNLRKQIEDAHDKEDYEKEQSEKRKEIFDLDMQIAELMRDGSEKAKARIAELEEERLKAQEDLLDFETDKAREDELKRLEKLQESEEKKIQDKIDGIQGQLDKLDEDTISVRNAIIAYAKGKGVTLSFAYASGTRSSVGGFGRINEKGIEMISAPDGNGNYVNLMPGSYVFSAKATEFLWKLATEHSLPQAMYNSIAKSIKTQSSTPSVNIAQPITITMGDIIIKGNADKQTVADIKKEQENTVRMVLQKIKELQK